MKENERKRYEKETKRNGHHQVSHSLETDRNSREPVCILFSF